MRSVVVTGGSRGLGLAIARKLAGSGYRVIAIGRKTNSELDGAMVEALAAVPDSFHFVPFDLTDIEAIPNLVTQIRKDHGSIYGLVNNAGTSFEGVLAMMPNHQIEQLLRMNTLSPIILTKYIVRSMMADGGGRIVNIASIIASTGYSGLAAYGATKAAVVGFTRSLAREVGRAGVNVNAVSPGFIATDLTQSMSPEERQRIERRSALRRLAEADDVADAVQFLLGDQAKNITGTVLTVDAGSTA
jgi:3-oxoacyl-[acyl-carrier protein] reductase